MIKLYNRNELESKKLKDMESIDDPSMEGRDVIDIEKLNSEIGITIENIEKIKAEFHEIINGIK